MVLTKPSSFFIISNPTNLLLSQHVRLTHVNVLGTTTGTNPGNEWGEGEETGAELQSGNKASKGVLGGGTMTEPYTRVVTLCHPCC